VNFITVVSGLPRSGTSLMMQMLAAGGVEALTDGIRQADEDNPRGYLELEATKRTRRDPSWLPQAMGKAVKVIHVLLDDLPRDFSYRVILMKRPIEEVLRSQRRMLERSAQPTADIPEERLAQVFLRQLQQAEERMASRPEFRVLPVQYHDCMRRPAEAVSAVQDFLGFGLNTAAMQRAVDPSLYRNRT
jgi:Sulfotransferase domain